MITGTIQERGSGIWTSGMGVLDYVTILDIYIYTYLHTYISTIGPLVLIVMITTGTIVIILVITKMKIQTIYVAVTMNNHDCGWLSLLPLVFIYIYIIYPKLWKCWWGKWWPLDVGLPCYSDKPLGIYFFKCSWKSQSDTRWVCDGYLSDNMPKSIFCFLAILLLVAGYKIDCVYIYIHIIIYIYYIMYIYTFI